MIQRDNCRRLLWRTATLALTLKVKSVSVGIPANFRIGNGYRKRLAQRDFTVRKPPNRETPLAPPALAQRTA